MPIASRAKPFKSLKAAMICSPRPRDGFAVILIFQPDEAGGKLYPRRKLTKALLNVLADSPNPTESAGKRSARFSDVATNAENYPKHHRLLPGGDRWHSQMSANCRHASGGFACARPTRVLSVTWSPFPGRHSERCRRQSRRREAKSRRKDE